MRQVTAVDPSELRKKGLFVVKHTEPESIKPLTKKIFRALTDGLEGHFELQALGRDKIRAMEKVLHDLARWIKVIEIKNGNINTQSYMHVRFKRGPDFKEAYRKAYDKVQHKTLVEKIC